MEQAYPAFKGCLEHAHRVLQSCMAHVRLWNLKVPALGVARHSARALATFNGAVMEMITDIKIRIFLYIIMNIILYVLIYKHAFYMRLCILRLYFELF